MATTALSPCLVAISVVLVGVLSDDGTILIDDASGVGRRFDGIGGLRGGGATSKLLVNYPEKLRDQILDYLFKPNFGAALQILKVEIGGDAQSTDGTEASHMHNEWEENYQRGYEWWLMKEAKKRNKHIKLYALPWGWPGWVGQGSSKPYTNNTKAADYIVRWINGAMTEHDLTIDYLGIWNERQWNADYVKTLRSMLDARGFSSVQLIVGDGGWDPAEYIVETDKSFRNLLYAVGAHYPGTTSNPAAKTCGAQLWSSEDMSTFNDGHGAGCWARILNQNYVNGFMTSTISWNLIASYYEHLPFYRCGLMTAVEPWSGNYTVEAPIWVSAHTTQFTEIGWYYLKHGTGVGKLPKGGSYVTLVSPNFSPFSGRDMTIVIETMTHDHSGCVRPGLPHFDSAPQTVTIQLQSMFLYGVHELNVWYSKLGFNGEPDVMFQNRSAIKFDSSGKAQLKLGLDEVWTLTTVKTGRKGLYPDPPASEPFPLPYTDDFEGYDIYQEPFNLAQQMGSYEVLQDSSDSRAGNKFARQMMLAPPVSWCQAEGAKKSLNVIGQNWTDIFVELSFRLPAVNSSTGVFVAARVSQGGCHSDGASGVFLFALPDQFILSTDLKRSNVITKGSLSYKAGEWHKISLFVQGSSAKGNFDDKEIVSATLPGNKTTNGFSALGTDSFGLADFDNLRLDSKPSEERHDSFKSVNMLKSNRRWHEPNQEVVQFHIEN